MKKINKKVKTFPTSLVPWRLQMQILLASFKTQKIFAYILHTHKHTHTPPHYLKNPNKPHALFLISLYLYIFFHHHHHNQQQLYLSQHNIHLLQTLYSPSPIFPL
jgi:hypothetical protein